MKRRQEKRERKAGNKKRREEKTLQETEREGQIRVDKWRNVQIEKIKDKSMRWAEEGSATKAREENRRANEKIREREIR